MAAQLYKTESGRLFHAGAIAIILVGLPARGKTHISRALCRYLCWLGVKTKAFHVGHYRRKLIRHTVSHDFFDPANTATADVRLEAANACLEAVVEYLLEGGQVGIYDGSNATRERQQYVLNRFRKENIQVVFVESICNDPKIVEANIRSVKATSKDVRAIGHRQKWLRFAQRRYKLEYNGWNTEAAIADFQQRIQVSEPYYQTIEDDSLSYIKLINVDQQIIVNDVQGFLPSRIVFYLMNLHTAPRTIYFARSGESTQENLYKADAPLSQAGHKYAQRLQQVITQRRKERVALDDGDDSVLKIWTSTQQYSYSTAEYFSSCPVRYRRSLQDINPGVVDGMSAQEIQDKYPREFEQYLKDPYRHRYPRGESYHDLAVRLEPVILELEHEKQDVLIIAHESVLRCLYAYFRGLQPEQIIPSLAMPRNTLLEITPSAYGIKENKIGIPLSD